MEPDTVPEAADQTRPTDNQDTSTYVAPEVQAAEEGERVDFSKEIVEANHEVSNDSEE